MNEATLIEALRAGDEAVFSRLIDRYHESLVRVARLHVRDRATAEEVAQDTWLAVLKGIKSFEGRSSFQTWLFAILINRAKTRGVRDGRIVPFSAIASSDATAGEAIVDPDRFLGADHERVPYHWSAKPAPWPEAQVLGDETVELVHSAIERLPGAQREVIRLRDVQGWSADEVCEALEITEGNQRVLLHRARARVRNEIETYIDQGDGQ